MYLGGLKTLMVGDVGSRTREAEAGGAPSSKTTRTVTQRHPVWKNQNQKIPTKTNTPPPNKPPTKQTTTKKQTLISGIKEAQGLKALPPSLTTTVQSLGLTRRTAGLPKGSSDPGAHALPRSHLPVYT